jgi:hypothetical protein
MELLQAGASAGISRRAPGAGVVVLATAACWGDRVVQNNASYPIPADARGLSPEQLDRLIYEAATARRWRMERRGPGQFHGTLARTSHVVWVDLFFDAESYRFGVEPASELLESGPGMEQEYARLIYDMRSDIQARLRAVRA